MITLIASCVQQLKNLKKQKHVHIFEGSTEIQIILYLSNVW